MNGTSKTILVVGGTRGIGGRVAERALFDGHEVIITGTRAPDKPMLKSNGWHNFQLHRPGLRPAITELVESLPPIHTLVYAAGYFHGAPLDKVSDDELDQMDDVKTRAPVSFARDLLRQQGEVPRIVLISSTSQWNPHSQAPADEVPYKVGNASLGMLARSLADDPRVRQTFLVCPSATASAFWAGVPGKDPSVMMTEDRAGDLTYDIMQVPDHMVFAMLTRSDSWCQLLERYPTYEDYRAYTRPPA